MGRRPNLLRSWRDAKRQTTALAYDALDRDLSKTVRRPDSSQKTTNAYDEVRAGEFKVGRMAGAAVVRRGYDALGRETVVHCRVREGSPDGTGVCAFSRWRKRRTLYDPAGNVVTVRHASGAVSGLQVYDRAGRLGGLKRPADSARDHTRLTRNARGHAMYAVYDNGVVTVNGYDVRSRIVWVRVTRGTTVLTERCEYVRSGHSSTPSSGRPVLPNRPSWRRRRSFQSCSKHGARPRSTGPCAPERGSLPRSGGALTAYE